MARVLLILAAGLFMSRAGLAQQFERVVSALPSQSLWTDGVALADVDGDGDVDILFANGEGYDAGGHLPQHLFLNDGSGTFTAAHEQLNVNDFNAKMVIAEDFDGDGDLDLLYAPEGRFPFANQKPRFLINQGGQQGGVEGVFANESATRLPPAVMASFCVCAGDVDDDGDLDAVFTNGATFGGSASQIRLYINDGNGFFTNVTGPQMPSDQVNAQDVTLFDYDGDFDVDIAVSGKGEPGKRGRLYLNDGSGVFSISPLFDDLGTSATYEVDYGDLDGDGDFDAAVQSISSQNEGWARNDGPALAPAKSTFPGPNGNDDNEMALLDYDDDGDLDVFVGSLANTGEKAYRNDGGSFANVNAIVQTINDATLDLGFADLDGNGTYDLVTGQGESGNFTNKVYMNGGPADTRPPTILGVDTPAPDTSMVFHIQLQDAVSDDGHISAGASWRFTGAAGAVLATSEGEATRMGGGLFRAAVDMAAAPEASLFTWTAADVQGNAASHTLFASDGPWTHEGDGTEGVDGAPVLLGAGALTAGTTATLTLARAAPGAACVLFLSAASDPAPFKGGVLYANPPLFGFDLVTGGSGELSVPLLVPPGAPAGTMLFWQGAVADGSATGGVSLTNALRATLP